MRSIRERLASGAIWSVAGAAASRGLNLVGAIVAARLLGQELFGGLGVVQSTIGMFVVFATMGVGVTATKHVAAWRAAEPVRAGRVIELSNRIALVAGLVMTALLVVLAPWLAERSLGAPELAPALRASALALLFSALQGAELGTLNGLEDFRSAAAANAIGAVAGFPFTIVGVWAGGVVGGAWALVASNALLWAALAVARRRAQRQAMLVYDGGPLELGLIWRFSVPTVLAGALVTPVNWLCTAELVRRPDGLAEMGLFSAANQWYQAALFVPGMVTNAVLPILSERMGAGDQAKSRRVLVAVIGVNAVAVLPIVLAATFGRTFLMGLYGASFAAGGRVLLVSILTAGILALQVPMAQILVATGRMWLGFFSNLAWAVAFYASTLALVDEGAAGVATARFVSYVLNGVWLTAIVWWLLREERNARQ